MSLHPIPASLCESSLLHCAHERRSRRRDRPIISPTAVFGVDHKACVGKSLQYMMPLQMQMTCKRFISQQYLRLIFCGWRTRYVN
jgi:hypothetical protein